MAQLYMQGLRKVTNMSDYVSIGLNNSWIMWPESVFMSLNMPEHGWINWSDYVRVFSVPQYSYNNIIIVTNVIILEFLSTRVIHPVALLPFSH